ncbi:MAG: PilZ domain-containing protein [Magnetococcales bacterium]|nr:PilZ domain-containing protein [Magnetococcales bacterium]
MSIGGLWQKDKHNGREPASPAAGQRSPDLLPDRRDALRITHLEPLGMIMALPLPDGTLVDGDLLDLALGGCRLQLSPPVSIAPAAESLPVTLYWCRAGAWSLSARVVAVENRQEATILHLAFRELSFASRQLLGEMVTTLQRQQLRAGEEENPAAQQQLAALYRRSRPPPCPCC